MTYFNANVAAKALVIVTPAIEQILNITGRTGCFVIIGDSDGNVLATKDFGERDKWQKDYEKIARSKFKITCKHKKSSRELQLSYPELVGSEGETIYWGSAIDGGIASSISGLPPQWDEFGSKSLVAAVRAEVTTKRDKVIDRGDEFT